PPADPLDLTEVAAKQQLVTGGAVDVEEVVEPALPLAEKDRQRADRGMVQARHHVGRKDFRLQRDGWLLFEGEGDCHFATIDGEPISDFSQRRRMRSGASAKRR